MELHPEGYKNFWYPPGGILLWILITVELVTFGAGLIVFSVYKSQDPELFHQSGLTLNKILGTANTLLLLTSGFFMKKTLIYVKRNRIKPATAYLHATIFTGVLFVIIKLIEYNHKFKAGISFDTNLFYTFYWLLTGFHLVHVVAGLLILGFFRYKISRVTINIQTEDMEAGAAFWHMCDLIWLLLFPALYLLT